VDCKNKVVQLVRLGINVPEFKANRIKKRKLLIAGTKARNMLAKSYQGYLACLLNKPKHQCTLESTTLVSEFQDVFPMELTSLPSSREVEFTVDLMPGAEPVSRALHQMALG
jgi:hypothetical protein